LAWVRHLASYVSRHYAIAYDRTGFIIAFADFSDLWQSKLQAEMALSTKEAKIIALSACCKELSLIINMVSSVTKSVKIPIEKTTMNVFIYEDNSGALVLVKSLPQHSSQSNFEAIRLSDMQIRDECKNCARGGWVWN
jgi:hypothetical protein